MAMQCSSSDATQTAPSCEGDGAVIYLSLGSNLQNRELLLQQAIFQLQAAGLQIIAIAPFFETEPWGFSSCNKFINTAVCGRTRLSPVQFLQVALDIEKKLGRKTKSSPTSGYADRPIDIDLLLYNECILQTNELTLPHPCMHQRLFVLEPLSHIAPDMQHPILHQTIQTLHNNLLAPKDL